LSRPNKRDYESQPIHDLLKLYYYSIPYNREYMPSLVRKLGLRQQESKRVRELVVGEAWLGLVNVDGCFTTGEQKAVDRRDHLIKFFVGPIPMDRNNIVIS
jgi:hypothetical protein